MKAAVLVARILLGLVFLVFGLNGLFAFLEPPAMNEKAMGFMGALMGTGYLLPVVKLIEVVAGGLLLAGRFVPLALVLLAPIVVNIFLFHVFLDATMLPLAMLIVLLEILLAWAYCDAYRGLLTARAQPRQ
jgi:uncharacterized membrane protein YphA (DoxX/SURF4 family)